MTQLLDRPPSDSSTLSQRTSRTWPGLQSAEDFYLNGTGHPGREIAIQVTGPDGSLRRTWLATYMQDQINGLLRLRAGWDGGRALALTDEAVSRAIEVLFSVASDLSLPPQIFPLPDGGVQMEWHAGQSIEIEIDAAGDAHALVADEGGFIVINEELTLGNERQLSRLRQAIDQLSIRLTRAR